MIPQSYLYVFTQILTHATDSSAPPIATPIATLGGLQAHGIGTFLLLLVLTRDLARWLP
jgi:hypothetical protein